MSLVHEYIILKISINEMLVNMCQCSDLPADYVKSQFYFTAEVNTFE
jgi:hypothetical protein